MIGVGPPDIKGHFSTANHAVTGLCIPLGTGGIWASFGAQLGDSLPLSTTFRSGTFPLAQTRAAQEAFMAKNHVGAIVVEIDV